MTVEHFLSIIGFSAVGLAIIALIGLAYLRNVYTEKSDGIQRHIEELNSFVIERSKQ